MDGREGGCDDCDEEVSVNVSRALYASVCARRDLSVRRVTLAELLAYPNGQSPAIPFLPTLHVNSSLNGLQVGPSDKTDIQSTTLLKTLKWTRCLCPPDPKARLRVLAKLVLFGKHTVLPPQQPPKLGPCQPPCRTRRQATE